MSLLSTVRVIAAVTVALATPVAAHDGLHAKIARVSSEIVETPEDPALYLRRGDLLRLHKDYTAAEMDLDRASQLRPAWIDVALVRARLAEDRGQPADALREIDVYLDQRDREPDAWRLQARVLVRLGREIDGVKAYDAAIACLRPPNADVYVARARLIAELGTEHLPRALASLEEGATALGRVPSLELVAIELELDLKRYDAALVRVERLQAASRRKERWHVRRGDILLAAGDKDAARAAYVDALEAIKRLKSKHRATASVGELKRSAVRKLREVDTQPARNGDP
jgi:tetratricopeptide (TPR) repeat protein